jgi:hypothetical protein
MANKKSAQPTQLDALISNKKAAMAPKDGRIEVALAIASVSSLVTVDATAHPFTTDPDDLFDHTFTDPGVGINDTQMAAFKANLTHLLPEISSDIANIPENANAPIEKVAEFVRLSLLAKSGGS